MFVIRKITQQYDPAEDRIALSVEDADGRVLLLWLTQRLASRLAAPVACWLDEDLRAVAAGCVESSLHAWEQAAARAQLKSDRSVEAATASRAVLVSEIDLTRGAQAYTLTFKWGGDGAACLNLNATELRQWLGILHQLFVSAEWPLQAWPAWLAPEAQVPASLSPLSLH